jgi:cytochrome c-type biogenesis protein CcsB
VNAAAWSDLLLEATLVLYAAAVLAYLAEIVLAAAAGTQRSAEQAAAEPLVEVRAERASKQGSPSGESGFEAGPGGLAPQRAGPGNKWTRRAERVGRLALPLFTLGVLFHLGAVVARGVAADRVPWGNMFEFAIVGALVAAGAFLVLQRKYEVGYLGVWVSAVVLGVVGFAVTVLSTEAGPLVPALRSTWLVIHVFAAILATALFTLGAVVSLLYLVADRLASRTGRVGASAARIPDRAALDQLAFRLHAVAFPIWTFAVMAGAVWAQYAWGRYWGWDPKETWAFVSWVVYAAYLHARVTAGWKGRRAAVIALAGYATMLFNFIGVNIFLTGFHSYASL